jgi:ketosteroid isomerase-like protein
MSPEGYSAVMEEESTTPDLVELNRRAIESATRGDFDAAMSSYGPDSVWDTSPLGMGTYRGVATIRTALEEWHRLYEELEVEIQENVDLGNGVILAVVRQRGRPVGSSGYAQLHFASVTEWTDRVISQVTPYTDIDEARAAAERLVESRGGRWQANVELVRKSFEAHRTGGIAAALRFYAPDFVWYPVPAGLRTMSTVVMMALAGLTRSSLRTSRTTSSRFTRFAPLATASWPSMRRPGASRTRVYRSVSPSASFSRASMTK